MKRERLNHYLPRGLYARAALILVLPVVLLQLVVSVSFVRRDLEDVTAQMSRTMLREIILLQEIMAPHDTADAAMQAMAPTLTPLRIEAVFLPNDAAPARDILDWTEYSGRVLRNTLRKHSDDILAVQLPDSKTASLVIDSKFGPLK